MVQDVEHGGQSRTPKQEKLLVNGAHRYQETLAERGAHHRKMIKYVCIEQEILRPHEN